MATQVAGVFGGGDEKADYDEGAQDGDDVGEDVVRLFWKD